MKQFTRIEDFNNGVLDDRQRMQFLEELNTNTALARELRLSKAIDSAITDQKARTFEYALQNAQKAYERNRAFALIYKVAASIAFLAIIGGSVLFYMNAQPTGIDKIASQYYEVYQPLNGMRGVDPVQNMSVKKAFETYSKGDYRSASAQFGAIAKADPSNIQARFYKACADMETGSAKQAAALFTSIIVSQDNFYTPLAEYYLGMCYLKTGEKDLAIRQFEKVANHQGGYQAKASKILKDLKSL